MRSFNPLYHRTQRPIEVNRYSPQARGLVVWWPTRGRYGDSRLFDNISGLTSNIGSANSWIINSTIGPMLQFDGTSNSAFSVGTLDPPQIGSLSIWLIIDDDTAGMDVLGIDDTYTILYRGDQAGDPIRNKLFATASVNLASNAVISADVLRHFVFTWNYSNNDMAIYIDGQLDASDSFADDDPGSGTFYLGRRDDTTDRWLHGAMGDIRIYNRVLSPVEVWHLYNPATRWDLYKPPPRLIVNVPAVGGRTTYNTDAQSLGLHTAMGWRINTP